MRSSVNFHQNESELFWHQATLVSLTKVVQSVLARVKSVFWSTPVSLAMPFHTIFHASTMTTLFTEILITLMILAEWSQNEGTSLSNDKANWNWLLAQISFIFLQTESTRHAQNVEERLSKQITDKHSDVT